MSEEGAVVGQCSLGVPLRDGGRCAFLWWTCRDSLIMTWEAQKAFGGLSPVICHL